MKAAKYFQELADGLRPFPWLGLAGLSLALYAQFLLEPPARPLPAVVFYLSATGFVIWSILQGEWTLSAPPAEDPQPATHKPSWLFLLSSLPFLAAAFYLFGGNRFTILNLALWLTGLALLGAGLWVPSLRVERAPMDREWIILLVLVLVLAAFFRFYRIDEVPAEPFSDHAEKILDVYDISQGAAPIFFERNTGREAIQMYWTLLVAKVFGTGFSFLSLKIGTALLGFLALPFLYLLGREFGTPLTGFLLLFMFGIAYWPNVISRIGLRFPLYPLFAAPTLFFLIRALRTGSRNDFILCGVFLGLGLHGYSPFRIMPLIVLAGLLLYMLHIRSREMRLQALTGLLIIGIVSLAIFLPLLRYWMEHPEIYGFRAWSRLGLGARHIDGDAWTVFLSNLLRGMLMFNWDDGDIWVNSVPHRPALDLVMGALFFIGMLLLIGQYIRRRDWRDIFLLALVPLLAMPSILSLAFPNENPALNRAGGAAIAAILVSARALEGLLAGFGEDRCRLFIGYGLVAVLLCTSTWQNYDIVFRKFDESFKLAVWNSSEMSAVIEEHGGVGSTWIVPYPQWVDTRLPALLLGIPDRDLALWPQDFPATRELPAPKLFIFKPEDFETENALKQIYPGGTLNRYTSPNIGKDFMIFVVEE
jgi:hypothetical protein